VKAFVTGGAGFIGSALVERLLAEGHEVDAVDDLSTGSLANLADARRSGGLSFHRLDIRVPGMADLIARRQPEVIFHLAAQADVRVSLADPVFDAEVNLLGSLRVFEGALRAGARKVVLAGSGGTLYGVPDSLPATEGHPQRPISPYGAAKKAAGDYLHYYREVRGLDYTILALANVYVPRQDPDGEAGVVAIFGGKLLDRVTPTIFGDGQQTRDFVYVDDVVDAFCRAEKAGGGQLINVGSGVETSVNKLYETMARLTRFHDEALRAPARPGELQRSALDPALAREVLGWTAATPLQAGLERTLDWFRSRRPAS
jgi:UDP-glucose 4-epimerase